MHSPSVTRPTGESGLYGPRGWTTNQGVATILQPYLTSIPHPDTSVGAPGFVLPAFATFAEMDAAGAWALQGRLRAENLKDRQNLAPRCDELLRLAVEHPDDVRLHGYAVGPARFDERVTFEGLWVAGFSEFDFEIAGSCHCEREELWEDIRQQYRLRTALAMPDEMWVVEAKTSPGKPGWWLWWD